MPTTINGIGTRYVGQSNVVVRQGQCGQCNNYGPLTSYDTHLWFVVVFIPVIPIGKKRILDQCARCSRHYAIDADEFQKAKERNVNSSLETYCATPTVDAALASHGQLCGLQQFEEAKSFRKAVLDEHPNDAELRFGLAAQLEVMGQFPDAEELLEAAYQLNPELPKARIAMARLLIRRGKLDDAHSLVAFMEKPGARQEYPLAVLDELAGGYQAAGRHDDALKLCRFLLSEYPELGHSSPFRQFVQRSEKTLKINQSMLPPKQSQTARWVAVGAAVLLLCLAIPAALNEYVRRNQTVYIVNGFEQPVDVVLDSANRMTIAGNGQKKINLKEGSHVAEVSGAVTDKIPFDVRLGFFQRWLTKPVWIVNVGGKSTLEFTRFEYAVNPAPSTPELIVNEKVVFLKDVDYPFTQPPDSLPVQGDQRIYVTHLKISSTTDEQLFAYISATQGGEAALDFAESRMNPETATAEMLDAYLRAAVQLDQFNRAKNFFDAGRSIRPVSVQWHRAFQNLAVGPDDHLAMLEDYDHRLTEHPNDAALLFLRGRISKTTQEGDEFFRKAVAVNPSEVSAWLELGFNAVKRGEWSLAAEHAKRAQQLSPAHSELVALLHYVRMANGEAEQLVADYRAQLRVQSTTESTRTFAYLFDALCSLGQVQEARVEFERWEGLVRPMPGSDSAIAAMKVWASYVAGEPEANLGNAGGPVEQTVDEYRFHAMLAQGKVADVISDVRYAALGEDPWNSLAISVALTHAGDAAAARDWYAKSRETFQRYQFDESSVPEILAAEKLPDKKTMEAATIMPLKKALLYTWLSQRFPENKAELLAEAKRFNLMRNPPYHLVQAIIDSN